MAVNSKKENYCPRDLSKLHKSSDHLLVCPKCEGKFLHDTKFNEDSSEVLSLLFEQTVLGAKLRCPCCARVMTNLKHKYSRLIINECPDCRGLWFDKGEEQTLSRMIEQQKKLKFIHLGRGQSKYKEQEQDILSRYEQYEADKKTSTGEFFFQIMSGLPLERNLKPVHKPVITWLLIVLNIVIFIISLTDLRRFVGLYAYVPANGEYHKVLFSMFMHGGFLHILGNMYFLGVLGDNVEDVLGPKRFLMLYFLAGIISGWLGGMFGRPDIPCIGASGAVAGVMAAYLLLFPKAKFLLRFYWFIVIPVSAFIYMLFWVGYQFIIAFAGGTNISWSGHLAGFVVGLIYVGIEKRLLYKRRKR